MSTLSPSLRWQPPTLSPSLRWKPPTLSPSLRWKPPTPQQLIDSVIDEELQCWGTQPPEVGKGVIYVGLCTGNGKMYVGQHAAGRNCTSVKASRWREHTSPSSNCTLVRNSVKKYGPTSFRWFIIEYVDEEDLDEKEVYWISRLRTQSPSGLNLLSGGNRPRHSDETIAKLKTMRNKPEYVAKLKKRRLNEWSNPENRKKWKAAMAQGTRNSTKFKEARKKAWANMAKEDIQRWIEKHRKTAEAKREQRLNFCTSAAQVQALKKYFAKLDRTKYLQALARAGLYVRKRRGPNTGRDRRAGVSVVPDRT